MKIIQQVNKTFSQMMGYTIVSETGEVLVIDGGERGDRDELVRIVKSVGGHIDLWLITHPHCDHHNAVMELISNPDGITYDRIGASQVSDEWAHLAGTSDISEVLEWNAFASRVAGARLLCPGRALPRLASQLGFLPRKEQAARGWETPLAPS